MSQSSSELANSATLDDALADYLRAVSTELRVDRDAFLQRYPEFAEELKEFMANHDRAEQIGRSLGGRRAADRIDILSGPDQVRFIGNYELLEVIARGGMGIVYKARHTTLDRTVALKMLSPKSHESHDQSRFQSEAEAAAALEHPNIVAIYDVGAHEHLPFYSMQFIDGADLREHLRDGPLPAVKAARLLVKLADAVEYAHQRGVLHRDLTPGNVLIDKRGEPYVADFGLAKIIHEDTNRTHSGVVLGTPSYMAPEQAAGNSKLVTIAVDIYGLGAILYAMLTGRAPFEGQGSLDVLHKVAHEPPRAPRDLVPEVPRDLEMICLKCLHKQPADRYASALDVRHDLERFLRHEPVLARPLAVAERAWRWCRRNPLVANLTIVLLLVLLTAAAGGAILAWRESQARQQAEAARLREREARELVDANLMDAYTTNGHQARIANEQADSLLWYATAADLAQDADRLADAMMRAQRRIRFVPQPVRAAMIPGRLNTLAFHPSSKYLLCQTGQEELFYWDLSASRPPQLVRGLAKVSRAAWSPDGALLAVGNGAGQFRVLQTVDGATLLDKPFPQAIAAIEFLVDRPSIAVASERRIEIVTLGKVPEVEEPEILECPANVVDLTINEAGTRLVALCDDNTAVVFDISRQSGTRQQLFEPLPHTYVPGAGAGSAVRPIFLDSHRLLVVHQGRGRIHDLTSGEQRADFDIGVNLVITANEDGSRMIVGGDRYARLWNMSNVTRSHRLLHREGVIAACFHPNGRLAATGSRDRRVKLWELRTGRVIGDLVHHNQVSGVQISPDGQLIATAQRDGLVRIWRIPVEDDTPKYSIPNPGGVVWTKTTPDGAGWFLSGAPEDQERLRSFQVYSFDDGRPLGAAIPLGGWLQDADMSPDATTVVTATLPEESATAQSGAVRPAGELQFWTWPDGTVRMPPIPLMARPVLTCWQPSGGLVAVLLENGRISLFHAATGQLARQLVLSKAPAPLAMRQQGLVFSPDGQWLAAFGADTNVELYHQSDNWSLVALLPGKGACQHLEFSPQGDHLVLVRDSGEVRVWNLETRREVGPTMPHNEFVYRARFSPDGTRLATACADNFARILDWRTGTVTCQPMTHRNDIFDAVFSPDGRWLFTIGDNNLLLIWSARDGGFVDLHLIGRSSGSQDARQRQGRITVAPDGTALVTAGWRHSIVSMDIRSLSLNTTPDPGTLRLASELAASARIEHGGMTPLSVSEWKQMWDRYCQTHWEHLQIDFQSSTTVQLSPPTASRKQTP